MRRSTAILLTVLTAILATTTWFLYSWNILPHVTIDPATPGLRDLLTEELQKGDTVRILDLIEAEEDEIEVVIDFRGLEGEGFAGVIRTDDPEIIAELREHLVFVVSGGDMATIESQLVVVVNGEALLRTSILVSERGVGIQNRGTGWADASNGPELRSIIEQFDPDITPIISL